MKTNRSHYIYRPHIVLFISIVIIVVLLVSPLTLFAEIVESHPFTIYTSEESDAIAARLSREPYNSWFERLTQEADRILALNVSWNEITVPKEIQGYYAKLLAFAYVFSDPDTPNLRAYGDEATRALNGIPGSSYSNVFSSDLEISEAVLFWAATYDMLVGASFDFVVDGTNLESSIREKFQDIRDYMARDLGEDLFPMKPSIQRDFLSSAYINVGNTDNHHVKLYSSLTVLSLVIADMGGFEEDYNRAQTRLLATLDNMTVEGGGWAEGPNYHLYAAHDYIPAIIALKNKGILDYSSLPELVQTHLMLPEMVMPDGKMPPIDDNEATNFNLAGILYSLHPDQMEHDMLLWMWDRAGRNVQLPFIPEYLAQFDDSPPEYTGPEALGLNPTGFSPESGFAAFRNSWDTDGIYLLVLSEHGDARVKGQAHEHPDPNSIILNAYSEMLLLDSGYGGWTEHDKTRFAENHNIILVDGEGPEAAAKSIFWNANGVDATLKKYFATPQIDYAVSETLYLNTLFRRHIVFPDHRFFFMYDRASSNIERTFTMLLHGNGGGTSGGTITTTDQGAVWERTNAALSSYTVGSADLEFSTLDMYHAVYNRVPMLTHSVLHVSQQGSDAKYLTLLFPRENDATMPEINALAVTNGEGISMAASGITDYGCIRSQGISITFNTDTDTFSSDGEFVYCSIDSLSTLSSVFLINGTHFTSESDTLLVTSSPVNLSVSYSDPNALEGYIQTDQESQVIIHTAQPSRVIYNGGEIPFSTDDNSTIFSVSGEGSLRIEYPAEAVETIAESIEISPADTTVVAGTDVLFTAVVFDSENAPIDTTVVWSVDAESNIGTVGEGGLFSAETVGTGFVIASLGDIADSAAVNVENIEQVAASIEIKPDKHNIAAGDSIEFIVEILDIDGEEIEGEVVWSLSDSTLGTIDEKGVFTAVEKGDLTVFATLGEIVGTSEITVFHIGDPVKNNISVMREKDGGQTTTLESGHSAEGDTLKVMDVPDPFNFMNGTKIYFPEGSLNEDITVTLKIPTIGNINESNMEVEFPDSILTAVSFEISVNDSVVHPYYFDVPLEVTIQYQQALLDKIGITPEQIGMFYLTETGELVEDGITDIVSDESNKLIRGVVSHFSDIVLAKKLDVSVDVGNDVPEGFSLSANSPNPFNPTTTITYTVPAYNTDHVSLNIYDIRGALIRTLVNEIGRPGVHSVVWDCNDNNGNLVSSGVYIYTFQAGEYIKSKSMTLLR
ncbi:Ig-like domain-containing protein [Candidatus Latescibacterota bacterium]